MKKDKELIGEIVDRLKSIEEFPYKEGAWETYKKREKPGTNFVMLAKYAAAAAVFLFAGAFSFYALNNKNSVQKTGDSGSKQIAFDTPAVTKNENAEKSTFEGNIAITNSNSLVENTQKSSKIRQINYAIGTKLDSLNQSFQLASINMELPILNPIQIKIPSVEVLKIENSSSDLVEGLALANTQLAKSKFTNTDLNKSISPKSFSFAEKFDLGLFVSPYSNADNLRVGAGLALAYNINKKLSVRTGASFNTYEVGILKNPSEASSVERIETQVVNSALQGSPVMGDLLQVSKLALPNINAITGFVRSVEIPLELKYNLSKSFYAVAGASYSTIVSQERNAQYVENVNFDTFRNGLPESAEEASKALEVVTKTVKSAEKNVSTSGYNGFINFSIGKKVDINRKFGVSIEPYYKIPVGEFRKADMNYSNGGIRIMTNF